MNVGSGKYHAQSRGFELEIIDLETDEQLADLAKEALQFESLPLIFGRPWEDSGSYMLHSFEYLHPCNSIKGSFDGTTSYQAGRNLFTLLAQWMFFPGFIV